LEKIFVQYGKQQKAFLFGPIEDNEYDPKMDTWPTDYAQMNILLSDETNHPLNLPDIQSLDYALRGFHPIEYMLWGVNSAKTANEFSPREIQYLTSLTEDVKNALRLTACRLDIGLCR